MELLCKFLAGWGFMAVVVMAIVWVFTGESYISTETLKLAMAYGAGVFCTAGAVAK